MDQSQEVLAPTKAVGRSVPGSQLEEHVQALGRRHEGGYTGYEEEYVILDQRSDNNFFGDFQEALKHVNRAKVSFSSNRCGVPPLTWRS